MVGRWMERNANYDFYCVLFISDFKRTHHFHFLMFSIEKDPKKGPRWQSSVNSHTKTNTSNWTSSQQRQRQQTEPAVNAGRKFWVSSSCSTPPSQKTFYTFQVEIQLQNNWLRNVYAFKIDFCSLLPSFPFWLLLWPAQNPAVEPAEADGHPVSYLGKYIWEEKKTRRNPVSYLGKYIGEKLKNTQSPIWGNTCKKTKKYTES